MNALFPLKNATPIWCNASAEPDEYAEFYTSFCYDGGKATLTICADSDYAVYLNGALCSFGQYHDYPYDRVYDTIEISADCRRGVNHLAIVVWHYGNSNMSYYPGEAYLLFQLNGDTAPLAYSGAHVRSRLSPTYVQNRCKQITSQLGFGFAYDATREDGWMLGEASDFASSIEGKPITALRPRPCKKLTLEAPREAVATKTLEDGSTLFDLGQNTVGFLQLKTTSAIAQTLTVSFGEHITDGRVRRIIGKRDFSVEITVRKGETVYLNPFRRLGCRYLEVTATTPLASCEIAVCPTVYPLREQAPPKLTDKEREIYDICVNTLRLCMHEHYEDCPWREQALYCMDSRNQMLCGYYAFGETEFPRANLELIAKDERKDGLLSICYPTGEPLAIPSFSLHFFTECAEYLRYSGDKAFLQSIYPRLERLLQTFLRRYAENGLVPDFPEKGHWNFYEWRKGLDASLHSDKRAQNELFDLALNALLSLALQRMAEIANALEIENDYVKQAQVLNQNILNAFLDSERGLCFDSNHEQGRTYSVLGNALTILCGAVSGKKAETVCQKLVSDDTLTPISVSMQCFLFDALLLVDRERYASYILSRIEQVYRPMVDLGLGTVWETELGEADFHNAGSLCHGWSALPIYYYHILK